ncbi:unnamed protein product [Lathyrus sativus]|nr:unnamed protein product [Lathyrus sativus]
MDHGWMSANRLCTEYEHVLFLCPCVRCANEEPKLYKKEIRDHLICEGICQSYTQCIWHGEVVAKPNVSQRNNASVEMDDHLEDMMCHIGQDSFKRAHAYDTLCSDKDKPLYHGFDSSNSLTTKGT